MEALLELVAVLALLHAALGLHWFPRSAYAFRVLMLGRVVAIPASRGWGSDRMGLLAGPPIPSLGRFHLVELFPLALSPEGVVTSAAFDPNPGGRTPRAARFVAWDDARRARAEGRGVFLGRERLVATGSDALARHVARTLRRIAAREPRERGREIEAFARASLDAEAARERVRSLDRATRPLHVPALATAVLLFLALPAVGLTIGLWVGWPWLLGALVLLQAWSGAAFFRTHRGLEPDERGERILRTLTVSVSPVEALRSGEVLGRDALARFHPLAAAVALLTRDDLAPFAERVLRDAAHPTPHASPPDDARVPAVESAWRVTLAPELAAAAARAGLPDDLARRPPPADPDEASYCPRCTQTFVPASGTCDACFGVPLVPLARSAARA
jgi:hypothetical protein